MKLELKNLAPYLPYGLKIKSMNDIVYTMCDKGGLSNLAIADLIDNPELYTPILRPLSDYEKFEQIVAEMTCYEMGMIDENANHSKMISYLTVELMFKYHIDVFNLIPQGLAIDINTLNKEL